VKTERLVEVPLTQIPKPYNIIKKQDAIYEVKFECLYQEKMDTLMAGMK